MPKQFKMPESPFRNERLGVALMLYQFRNRCIAVARHRRRKRNGKG